MYAADAAGRAHVNGQITAERCFSPLCVVPTGEAKVRSLEPGEPLHPKAVRRIVSVERQTTMGISDAAANGRLQLAYVSH